MAVTADEKSLKAFDWEAAFKELERKKKTEL